MNRFLRSAIASVVLLPLAVVFLPLIYAAILMLVVVLPPILVVATFVRAKENRERGEAADVPMLLFLALIAIPLALLAALAPIRAILVGTFSLYPPLLAKFNEPHEIFLRPLVAAFGELAPYWLDFYWGIYGVLLIFVAAVLDSVRRNMLVSQIRNLSTSRVRSVAVGLAELAGKAVPMPGKSAGAPIIRSWMEKTDDNYYSSKKHIDRFYLDDGTGLILVDATGSNVELEADGFSVGLHQVKLRQCPGENGLPEGRLMPGDPVFVLGSVQINEDRASKERDPVVIKPKRSSFFLLNYYDIFFLGNGDERALLDRFARSVHRGWLAVVTVMAVTGWLSINAWTGISQLKAMDIEAAPALFHRISAPTVLERSVEVPGLGARPALHWIDRLGQEGGGKHEILRSLQRERLAHLAIPTLLKRVADIDHPDYGVANYWLMALKALPPGHWGFEYYGREYKEKGDNTVFRVMLKREGTRLIASYDVYFDEAQSIKRKVSARKVVLVFKDAKGESVRTVSFDAQPGWNRVRGVEAFDSLAPGEYRFHIYPRREFGSMYDAGRLPVPEVKIRL
jgi:hypothetical protein